MLPLKKKCFFPTIFLGLSGDLVGLENSRAEAGQTFLSEKVTTTKLASTTLKPFSSG